MLAYAFILLPLAFGTGPDYASEIQPIFERSCYACHGPERQKSGYRLDVRSIALKGGDSEKRAIIAHDSASSPLIHFVSGADPDAVMPPENSKAPPLSEAEVTLLRAWIDAGPSWPEELANEPEEEAPHWSLLPLLQPEVPGEAANPVDAFIRAKLAEKDLTPSPEADRRTLIQRVCYDLTGLPPTPEEVDAFCADPDPLAYEKLVDRLLASPRYGERWARHWFDTIQFAESHGYEHDIGRYNAWPYRDYVIGALNSDKPYARFIREQLAADYFYPDEPELTPALGFLGASPFDLSTYLTAEVTFDYLARDTLVTQTMAAFTSTTANCARCHTHKFDPIPQADYYALQAVFSGALKGDKPYDADLSVKRERARWNGIIDAAHRNDVAALQSDENEALVRQWTEHRGAGAVWTPLNLTTYVSTEGATLSRDGEMILASGRRPEKDTYILSATTELTAITALRLDVFAHDSFPMNGPGRQGNGNFHLSEFELRVFKPDETAPANATYRRATADFNQTDWDIGKSIDGNGGTAWGIHPAEGQNHHAVFEFETPLETPPGTQLAIVMKQNHGDRHTIGAFSISVTGDNPETAVALPAEAEAAIAVLASERTEAQQNALTVAALRYVAEAGLAALPEQSLIYTAAAKVLIPAGGESPTPAAIEKPKPVHRMERGDFELPQEEVFPGALSALEALPARFNLNDPDNEAERRAALADWIASPENVLAWRSIVNRVWHYHFGHGLCDTPSDIGRMGGTPSHPELIDWLAVWFRDDAGGSMKALHRLIVTSATYRQSSAHRDNASEVDGENRLLWRQNVHRLDADAYRDYTLANAGTLDLTMGGPSVEHFTQGPGPQLTPTLDYKAYDWRSEGAGRRSIYSFVWRGIADPFMEALDFPDLGLLSPKRGFSASSLQALALYNDPFVLYHSQAMANRLEAEAETVNDQIARAAQLLWYRSLSDEERAGFRAYASEYGLAALCRVLLNSNEYLFVE